MQSKVNHSELAGGQRESHDDRVLIQDPVALEDLLRIVLKRRSMRAVSRESGISEPLLSRLCGAKNPKRTTVKEISQLNYRKLFQLVPPEKHKALRRAFVIGTAARIRDMYTDWVWQQVQRASNGHYNRWYWTPKGLASYMPSPVKMGTSDRDLDRLALWRYLRDNERRLHRKIETMLRKVRVSGYRELAWTRILDPLINSTDSAFVEPSWREWRRTKPGHARLVKFIRAGFRREQMLLTGRVTPTQRAKSVLGMSLDEFVARFGERSTGPHTLAVETELEDRLAAQSVGWGLLDRSRYQTQP